MYMSYRSESCYINTTHPDFINGHKAMTVINEKLGLNRINETNSPSGANPSGGGSSSLSRTKVTGGSNPSIAQQISASTDGFFSSFFSKKPERKPGVLEPVRSCVFYLVPVLLISFFFNL